MELLQDSMIFKELMQGPCTVLTLTVFSQVAEVPHHILHQKTPSWVLFFFPWQQEFHSVCYQLDSIPSWNLFPRGTADNLVYLITELFTQYCFIKLELDQHYLTHRKIEGLFGDFFSW